MKIAIRLDDITPGMDWAKFNQMKALLDGAGIRPLIGVVPDSRDPKLAIDPPREDFWEYVRSLQESGWTIALHGLYHVYTTKSGGMLPLNHQSEFAGLPLDRQQEMIAAGRQILAQHGLETDLFMAPSHSYDRNTLKALLDSGFTKLTDGFGTRPYEYSFCPGLTFYPISFDRKQVLEKGQPEPSSDRAEYTTFVLHTNTMTERDFSFYEKVLREQDVISYDEYLRAPAAPRGEFGRCREFLMARAKYTLVHLR